MVVQTLEITMHCLIEVHVHHLKSQMVGRSLNRRTYEESLKVQHRRFWGHKHIVLRVNIDLIELSLGILQEISYEQLTTILVQCLRLKVIKGNWPLR